MVASIKSPDSLIEPGIDTDALRATFRNVNNGHVYVNTLVKPAVAAALHCWLSTQRDWGLTLCMGEHISGLPPSANKAASFIDKAAIADGCYKRAQEGFAFLREEVWGGHRSRFQSEECVNKGSDLVGQFVESREFLDFCAKVSGVRHLELTEVSCVRYGPGDFYGFTVGGPPNAELGFTFDLTPNWELEWGGLLEILNLFGGIEHAYIPRFNGLCLYSLRRHHGISYVTPFSRQHRYSICGRFSCVY